jgi:hypothetical protein
MGPRVATHLQEVSAAQDPNVGATAPANELFAQTGSAPCERSELPVICTGTEQFGDSALGEGLPRRKNQAHQQNRFRKGQIDGRLSLQCTPAGT